MKKLILIMFSMMLIVSCNKEQKNKVKVMTAQGLSQGITAVLTDAKVVMCDDQRALYEYVEAKACKALKADCPKRVMALASISDSLKKYACKSAIKIVGPMILPGQYLPLELKMANCKMSQVDGLLEKKLNEVCDRI